ncbi:MAG: valine--tRNA ligase, partial [Gaiellales bacterium]
ISDLEVEQKELVDELIEIAYPVVDDAGTVQGSEELVIATVRSETIVADVAVAVHPEDDRYRHLIGRRVQVPLTERVVPVIADDYVDREFGTGALKITPGHDPNDFEIGARHGLEQLSAINPDRTMTELAGEFAGLDADAARTAMVDKLDQLGLIRGREDYRHNVPHSQRSGVRIEPLISLQWFADMTALAKPVIQWVRDGDVRFIPEGSASIFYGWMEELQPWCLSRQLWWGHQLPVWYCASDESHVHVSADGPGAMPCPDCGNTEWRRDEDVLDTWFSSGMWDHATLGWPEQTADLAHFHPTSVLCTARDIINLWVARMMMFSYAHLGEVPFRDVYIHSTIQAADGRRMSKSLGTGIDPLELIAKYGADATRYGLLDMSSTQDVRFNEGRIKEGHQLANKLWNAVRLLTVFGDPSAFDHAGFDPTTATRLEDRWILTRLDRVLGEVTRAFDGYEFALAVKAMYAFTWHELCDWYLESVKGRLRSEDEVERADATRVLSYVINRTIRMLHPVMPHLTEELAVQVWGEKGLDGRLVALSPWHERALPPEDTPVEFETAADSFGQLQRLVTRLRGLRQAADIKPKITIEASLQTIDPAGQGWHHAAGLLRVLANVDVTAPGNHDEGIALPITGATLTLYGLDPVVLRPRLEADLKKARAEVKRAEGKLRNEKFTSRAPQELVDEERGKVADYTREAEQLEGVLGQL